jgi:hypothetical protein
MIQNVAKFAKVIDEGRPEGYHGVAYGAVMEEIVRPAEQGKAGVRPGRACVILIGWETVELHMEFRESVLFKENIALLRTGTSGSVMVS